MALLSMVGVCKSFPGVVALDHVDFEVAAGEVRALLGENGAGKSTLVKVLTGVHERDGGEVFLDGVAVSPRSPAEAQSLGISTVYQEVNLATNLSVAANVCLGRESTRFGFLNWKEMTSQASAALDRLGIKVDPDAILGTLPIAVQQLVAIARAVDCEARVLVLDEPTSSLDKDEVEALFDLIRKVKDQGIGIVFITHFLEQVFAVADSVTVLRNGKHVSSKRLGETSRKEIVSQMLGRELEDSKPRASVGKEGNQVAYRVAGLGRHRTMRPFDLEIGRGESVGLGGLLGSGRTESLKLIFGALAADSGTVQRSGSRPFRPRRPSDAIHAGVGFCSEDRKAEGVLPGLSVAENMLLVVQARRGWLRKIPQAQANALVNGYIDRFQIKVDAASRAIETLSGGNQQKVLLSRWLASEPHLLLLDEPTRGIDIGSRFDIRKIMDDLRIGGMSLVFTSSEIEEVVEVCDRVAVLSEREFIGVLSGSEVEEGRVMGLIADGRRA